MTSLSKNIYYKVNELRANLILEEKIFQAICSMSSFSVFELRKSFGEWASLIADPTNIRPKLLEKHPTLTQMGGIIPPQALEQSTRDEIAQFKASLVHGTTALDLTGGIGAEDWALAQKFQSIISLDSDPAGHQYAI